MIKIPRNDSGDLSDHRYVIRDGFVKMDRRKRKLVEDLNKTRKILIGGRYIRCDHEDHRYIAVGYAKRDSVGLFAHILTYKLAFKYVI